MNIAFLGLGAMGSRMATNLIGVGHALWVWNRSAERTRALVERGAEPCASPAEAASRADVTLAMVRDDAASRAVWLDAKTGAARGLRPGAVAIECSTLGLDWCRELTGRIRASGAEFLDAPVVGSRPQAEAHQLIHLVGGEAEALERVRDILAVNAAAIHHIGASGAGMTVKLMINALFGIQVAAVAELIALARARGIDAAAAFDALCATPVASPAAKATGAAMLARNFAPAFPVDLVAKDFGLIAASAATVAATIPVSDAAGAVYRQGVAAGFGADNITGIVQVYDRAASGAIGAALGAGAR